MPPLNASSFSKNTNPTIHNVFPELNQGKRYLQKQTEVEKKINNTRNFIESFTPYNKRGQLKKCSAVGQASANKHVPCACGNAMCTTSTPYCNYQLGACFSTPTNQNQAKEDWDVNSNCSGDGQFSSCKAKAGCASYGYCAPPMKINPLVQWDNDRSRARDPNGGDLQLNSLMGQQTMTKADYMSNVQQYVNMPPPCNGDLANCQANPPYYGRNVTIPQQIGPAPYGPGYPHPACGLEVLGNPGDGGTEAVSRAQVESLDAACHAEPDCVGFGQKSGGGWDFLKWNANPAYLGPTDTQMKTPGNYPKYFYIQNPVTGCNSSKCCGIQGTPGNCKTDPYDPACYVPGGAPPVPNTPTPTAAPPPPSIDGGWSGWSTSCPPAPNNIQTRTCSAPPPAYGGADCSALDGGNGYRACNPPVNGGWSDWTTGCPPAPGNQQTRSCTAPSTAYGGTPCSGPSSRPCFSPSTFSPTPAPPPSSLYPPPTFWPQPKEEYAYYNQGEALAACKKAGYAGLCNSASVIAKGGQCSAGYVSDSTRAGYYCPEGGCGSPAGCGGSQGGWRTWYPSGYHAGAYCCGVAGSTETCKGMDGRYDVGDPRRYTGGWSLEGGSPDAASCDALCYDQPECKVSGQTCNPIYYGYSKNCYCDFCVSK